MARRLAGLGLCLCAFAALAETPAIPVAHAPLAELSVPVTRSLPARVIELRRARLAAEIAAPIRAVPVEVGEQVVSGQTVAEFDCRDARLQAEQVNQQLSLQRARLALADQQLARIRRLADTQMASAEALDQQQAEQRQATAQVGAQIASLELAKRQVEKCTLLAPYDGVIVAAPGQPGSYATPGTLIIEMADPQAVELEVQPGTEQAAELAQAEALAFTFAGQRWAAQPRAIVDVIDRATQTRAARFTLPAPPPPPGANGRLEWQLQGYFVPPDLVLERDGRLGVFVLNTPPESAGFHPLPHAIPGQPARLNLPGDTLLITRGRHALVDGARVTPAE